MSVWKNVLVYADARPESELALSEGLRLASHADGRVMVMDVLHHLHSRIPPGLLAMAQQEVLGLMLEQRHEEVNESVERLPGAERVKIKIAHGNPAFELIREAVNGGHDLIVKAARGRDVRHNTSFGTTALHLVRKSPVPVLVLSPDKRLLERPKVLCAVEPVVDDDDDPYQLNVDLLAAARLLAEIYGAQLHVVHVMDVQKLNVYRGLLPEAAFDDLVRGWDRDLKKSLDQLLATEFEGLLPALHTHLLAGDPADVIVDMVATERVSHLVMGSVGDREPGHLVGRLTEEVLSRIDCSLLTMKPPGFQTPIALGEAAGKRGLGSSRST